jgi:SWI/SNF-related matrix-associated actin-dependent regulator 1 of chromatin subfamily A
LQAAGSRALIFSQFTAVLDILEVVLRKALGVRYLRIDGSTATAARQAIMDEFAADKGIGVMLLSTRAGGVGINLTPADTVIIHDCDWNPLGDAQAEDRAHRMGQTRPVTVYRLATARTIEVHMAAVVAGKADMAQSLMVLSERHGGAAAGAGGGGVSGGAARKSGKGKAGGGGGSA